MRENQDMSTQDGALRVGVVGCGSFGRNHARVYRDLHKDPTQNVEFVGIADCDKDRVQAIASEFGTQAFATPKELIAEGVQAVSIAVPTVSHLEVARTMMENGVDVLIEKPLASTVAEADELIALARKHGRVAQAGHLERFNPAVRATLPLLKNPMFFEVHRLSVFTPRSLDVDVILDLMIHDLDVVLSFVNSPVKEIRAVGLPILSKKGRHRQRAHGIRIGLRGKFHRQPGEHRTYPEAEVFSAASIHFARLLAAGRAGAYGGRYE